MTPHDKLQVMTSLSLPSACPAGQKKIVGNFFPTIQDRLQYNVSFEAFLRLGKSSNYFANKKKEKFLLKIEFLYF